MTKSKPTITDTINSYPEPVRAGVLALRDLILETADEVEGVGQIEEALRWGQPSYLTSETGSGTTIRIAPTRPGSEYDYGMYVHCQTNLVAGYRDLFGDLFNYDGDRGLLFKNGVSIPTNEVRQCIAMALTYHQRN